MSQKEGTYTIRGLIAAALAAIIGTVVVLDSTDSIKHSDNKDHVPIGDFTAVHLVPGEQFRMSPKSSELHAVCENGYLAIASNKDPSFRGIIVDYKNRGVLCSRPAPVVPAPTVMAPSQAPEAAPQPQQEQSGGNE